jgi:ATP-dependent phosphofructokinase / diphosphate-dependent phosphofructokinase
MDSHIRRIAVNTGGGDAPGLNAVIRAVVLAAEEQGWEVYGIDRSYDGLFEEDGVYRLDRSSVRGITHLGGTILGTTNRGNPLHWPVTQPDGTVEHEDRTQAVIDALAEHGIDALVAIGGDGSLSIAHALFQKGLKVVGVPKTIDNDIAFTDVTFGFDTAVHVASAAIDRLHTTAEAHDRVIVVEVMGRHVGHIAVSAGIAGGATMTLIPEVPFDIGEVCDALERRHAGMHYASIVVVAEGAVPAEGTLELPEYEMDRYGHQRLGGISNVLASEIEGRTGIETRVTILGHVQRGGTPTAFDRVLATRFGVAAADAAAAGSWGKMVALHATRIELVELEDAVGRLKTVDLEFYDEVARPFFAS